VALLRPASCAGATLLRGSPTITRRPPEDTREAEGSRFVYTMEDDRPCATVPATRIGADARGTAYPVDAGGLERGTNVCDTWESNRLAPT
jgi:hypothetical protein